MNDLHGLLFAYRADANLGELTRPRNTCSLPFGGRYRLIDFMLSNYVNAGISDVGIIVHQNYQSLLDHLGSGKDWDLSRKHGCLRILPPFSYARRGGDYRGPMDALAGVSDYLNNIRQDYVILGRGDVALNLPVADVFQQHLDSGADVTVVCTPTLRGAPRSSEYVEVSESGRITDLSIHPIAAGDADVRLPRFPWAIDCAAHHRHLDGFLTTGKGLLHLVGKADQIDPGPAAGGARDNGRAGLIQSHRPQDVFCCGDLLDWVGGQGYPDGIADAVRQQRADAHSGFHQAHPLSSRFGDPQMEGVIKPLGSQAVSLYCLWHPRAFQG